MEVDRRRPGKLARGVRTDDVSIESASTVFRGRLSRRERARTGAVDEKHQPAKSVDFRTVGSAFGTARRSNAVG